jgi:ATP diphosphatase
MLEMARILRGPRGCPWDREQTIAGLASYLVEEAHEVLHAAEAGPPGALTEELGDAFFLLALVQRAAEEAGGPPFSTVMANAVAKIAERHPHVFREAWILDRRTAGLQWEERKRAERAAGSGETDSETADPGEAGSPAGFPGALAPGGAGLPALIQAQRLQERAALAGFDWPAAAPVFDKIEEEIAELREALALPEPGRGARVREELGDLLFAVVNLVRLLRFDAEHSLRDASDKFRERYNRMCALAAHSGAPLPSLSLEQMETFWEAAKREERQGETGTVRGIPSDPP